MNSKNSRNRKKNKKQLDSFQQLTMAAINEIYKQRKTVSIILLSLLMIAIGVGVAYHVYHRHQLSIKEQLAAIDDIFEKETKSFEEQKQELQKKLNDLEKKINQLKNEKKLNKSQKEELDKLNKEKEQLEKQQKTLKADHSRSREQYEAFFKKHPHNLSGLAAGVKAASLYLEDHQLEPAVDLLTTVVKNAPSSAYFYQIQTRLQLVAVLEDKKDFDGALKQLDIVDQYAQDELKARRLFIRARLLMAQNKTNDAAKILDQIIKDFSSDPVTQRAKAFQAFYLNQ